MRLFASLCVTSVALTFSWSAAAQRDPARDDDLAVVPALRFALGPGFGLHADEAVETDFEATIGASALRERAVGIALHAEGGYTSTSGAGEGAFHGGNLTVGIGYGKIAYAFLVRPRLLLGTHEDELAIGMRNGVSLHLAADLASLELAHQFLRVAEGTAGAHEARHDIVLLLGLNPGAFLYILPASADPRSR